MLLSTTADKLAKEGVRALGIVATNPARAQLFFRYRPPRLPVGADPDLATHRAYGLLSTTMTPEIWGAIQSAAGRVLGQLGQPAVSVGEAYDQLGRLDEFVATETDHAEEERHQAQLCGQFLIDRDGIVRWAYVECARDGFAGVGQMPSDEELLAAVRTM